MAIWQCSASSEPASKRHKIDSNSTNLVSQELRILSRIPGAQRASSATPKCGHVRVVSKEHAISRVVDCMASRYSGVGSCSQEDQNIYTTREMQATALRMSLQLGASTGIYDSFASVLGAVRLAPDGENVALQFYQSATKQAIRSKSGMALGGLLLAGPDIMIRNVDIFHKTLRYAGSVEHNLLDLCFDALSGNENTFETPIKEAILLASKSCPPCFDALLRRLWSILPRLSWKIDKALLQHISKSSTSMSTILRLVDGRFETYGTEVSTLLVGASSGHVESLTIIIRVISPHAEFFTIAIGKALEIASKGQSECVELILPLIKDNVELFAGSISNAIKNSAKGHYMCFERILPLTRGNVMLFEDGISWAMEYASFGHLEYLQLILPIIRENTQLFKDSIGWALVNASTGYLQCLELILPLYQSTPEYFTSRVGRALMNASSGNPECLQLVLSLVKTKVNRYRHILGNALVHASKSHSDCLELILQIIKGNEKAFIPSFIQAFKDASQSGDFQTLALLEASYDCQ